jgi:hypothetical protein
MIPTQTVPNAKMSVWRMSQLDLGALSSGCPFDSLTAIFDFEYKENFSNNFVPLINTPFSKDVEHHVPKEVQGR